MESGNGIGLRDYNTKKIYKLFQPGTLGGKFSTIEGLLKNMHDHLSTFFCSSNDTSTLTEDSSKMKL